MIRLLLCLSLLDAMLACAREEHARVKVGGSGAIRGDDLINRYTVLIRQSVRRQGKVRPSGCTGSLLDPSHVLLAAHCIMGAWKAKVLVGYDKKVILKNGAEFSAVGEGVSFVANKSYLSRSYTRWHEDVVGWLKFLTFQYKLPVISGDIAVIKLKKPLHLPYSIDYKIPESDEVDLTGKKVVIAGYGIGDIGQEPFKARKAEVRVARDIKDSDLLEFDNFFNRINFGDSGGPVWWYDDRGELNLIGVHVLMAISFKKLYSYSLDIRHHRQWIKGAIRVLQEKDPLLTKDMDMIKRYFAGAVEDFYKDHTY